MQLLSLIVVALLMAGCGSRPMPDYGTVPAFQLDAETGKPFDRNSLAGHVWVADFVFTNCEGPCPRMSSHMAAIQNDTPTNVRLVSFTVDPARDTPPVLTKYSQHFKADPARWHFLTGDPATLNTLDHDVFKLGNVGAGLDHSTRFVLVDKKGNIRGYYGLSEGDVVARVSKDAARLEKEPA